MDILRFGPDAEVVAPSALRVEVRERLVNSLQNYGDVQTKPQETKASTKKSPEAVK